MSKYYKIKDDTCPFCKVRKVEIDDMGYYGCEECYPGMT